MIWNQKMKFFFASTFSKVAIEWIGTLKNKILFETNMGHVYSTTIKFNRGQWNAMIFDIYEVC